MDCPLPSHDGNKINQGNYNYKFGLCCFDGCVNRCFEKTCRTECYDRIEKVCRNVPYQECSDEMVPVEKPYLKVECYW